MSKDQRVFAHTHALSVSIRVSNKKTALYSKGLLNKSRNTISFEKNYILNAILSQFTNVCVL